MAEPGHDGSTSDWTVLGQIVGVIAAVAGWVAVVGGAREWARLHAAHIPATQTLAGLPKPLLAVEGLQTLLLPLLIGGITAVFVYYTWPEKSVREARLEKRRARHREVPAQWPAPGGAASEPPAGGAASEPPAGGAASDPPAGGVDEPPPEPGHGEGTSRRAPSRQTGPNERYLQARSHSRMPPKGRHQAIQALPSGASRARCNRCS